MTEQMTAQAALDRLETLYTQSVTNLRDAVRDFVNTGERPDPLKRAEGVFAYPELRIRWDGDRPQDLAPRAYARLSRQGSYSTTVTQCEGVPWEALRSHARTIEADIIGVGSSCRRVLRTQRFGKNVRNLLEFSDRPLFLSN